MRSNIHNVRKTIAALREALLSPSPEGLDSQIPAVQEAGLVLDRAFRGLKGGAPPDPDSRSELEGLARELRAPARLIEQGLLFTRGMARLLAPATGGYQPDGEPEPLASSGTILVRG